MATTKLWKVTNRLDQVLDYDVNEFKTKKKNYKDLIPDLKRVIDYAQSDLKTEEGKYVTGINCVPETAYEEMQITKKRYGKTDKILAFHGVQSFASNDNITPELAHQIGVELANELWGDRFEVVVSTHLNTGHIHNHFTFNSVSFIDGKKYNSDFAHTAMLRHVSDELCIKYGLSVLQEKKLKSGIDFRNFYKKAKGIKLTTYESATKEDVDYAIRQAKSYKDFENILKDMGYTISHRADKLSLCHLPYKRNIRIERRFGEDYTIRNIRKRIEDEILTRVPFPEENSNFHKTKYSGKRFYSKINLSYNKFVHGKGSIYRLYIYYRFLLKSYQKTPNTIHRQKVSAEMRADIQKLDEMTEEIRFIKKNKIETKKDLIKTKNKIQVEKSNLKSEENKLKTRLRRTENSEEKIEITKTLEVISKDIKEKQIDEIICERIIDRIPDIYKKVTEEEIQNKNIEEKEQEKNKNKEEQKI